MMISQIFDPAELVSLNDRQLHILNALVLSEVIASPKIKEELSGKLRGAMAAMQKQSRG